MASDYNNKVKAIKQMLDLFKFERIIYVSVTLICLVVLIGSAVYMIISDNNQIPAIIGMFGSSGAIAYTCGRLLKMWSDAMKLLMNIKDKDDGN